MTILDREGDAARTVRRVEADMGMSTEMLCKCFRNRKCLLDGVVMADDIAAEAETQPKGAMTRIPRGHESHLAWSLADILKPHMDAGVRARLCAQIGAGDYRRSLEHLLHLLVELKAAVTPEYVRQLRLWADGYAGSDDGATLHRLVGLLSTTNAGGTNGV